MSGTTWSIGSNRTAVILAGGDGKRLEELTRRLAGFQIPKQFCALTGKIPLIEQTRRRILPCVPHEQIFFVLNRAHQHFFDPLLADVREQTLVIQPANRGTAPAILYSLLRLAELAPTASVLLMPSDHYVEDEARLIDHIQRAFITVEQRPEFTVLLGIVPDQPETAYGWIEPGPILCTGDWEVSYVRRFWEKPSDVIARELMEAGCLWNSFMIVGRVTTLLGLFMVTMPGLYRAFSSVRPALATRFEEGAIKQLYSKLASSDFSREVLQTAAVNLAVLPIRDIGWTDLGEPARVAKALGSRRKRSLPYQSDEMAPRETALMIPIASDAPSRSVRSFEKYFPTFRPLPNPAGRPSAPSQDARQTWCTLMHRSYRSNLDEPRHHCRIRKPDTC
jgi:mannose-1-phosphate guanylyltransferase